VLLQVKKRALDQWQEAKYEMSGDPAPAMPQHLTSYGELETEGGQRIWPARPKVWLTESDSLLRRLQLTHRSGW
jgi:hypothetical protein